MSKLLQWPKPDNQLLPCSVTEALIGFGLFEAGFTDQMPLLSPNQQCLSGACLVRWEINVPLQHKIGYMRDKVLGGDLVPPG